MKVLIVLLLWHSRTTLARKRVYSPLTHGSANMIHGSYDTELLQTFQHDTMIYNEELAESHRVHGLPGLPFGYNHAMYAGHVSVKESELHNNGTLFYWLLESQSSPEDDPLVIWINGGPGCSSLEGLLVEHGPFLAVANGFDLELNAYSWNRNANVLYLDQPVGTGFATVSDGAYARSQHEVNIMFMAFMDRWMAMFPHFKTRPLFLAGESYAGRYIPHFANQILSRGAGLNLQGVLIGNGWTHPMIQSEALVEYSLNTGLISTAQKRLLDQLVRDCRAKWDADPYAHETWVTCEKIQSIIPGMTGNSKIGLINMYDVRLYDTTAGGEWPWRSTGEKDYLNRQSVKNALHVNSRRKWEECSEGVEYYLTHEDMYPTVNELESLLPRIRVLVYNGQFDWICNHLGAERFLDSMHFEGETHFKDDSHRGLWVSGGRLAGYVKNGGNLTFITVLGGSHMVPMNKRPETFEMLMRFLKGSTFSDMENNGPMEQPVPVRLSKSSIANTLASLRPTPDQASALKSKANAQALSSPPASDNSGKYKIQLSVDLGALGLMMFGTLFGLSLYPLGNWLLNWASRRQRRVFMECDYTRITS